MGMNGTQPYEIYNMTRTTSSSQPFVGLFAFDYIVLQGSAYGYIEAEARPADNMIVRGKSDNLSMNRSEVAIGTIVLDIPSPDMISATSMASPSTATTPTPGFEAPFAIFGLLWIACLLTKKHA